MHPVMRRRIHRHKGGTRTDQCRAARIGGLLEADDFETRPRARPDRSAHETDTQLAAIELAPRVRVNAILPGCVETEALRGFMDAMPDVRVGLQSKTPMRRNGTPEDIASAALFFASPAARQT